MARLARFVLPEHPQHIILKGINKMTLFVEDEDFQHYLSLLQGGCEKHACALHAYVLLPSEIHLLLTPSTGQGVSKLMQMLGRYYVQHFNKKYDRSGTLWEGRYRGTLVDPANYLLKVYRFIEAAPVRLGLVSQAVDYAWSSYAFNSSAQETSGLLSVHKEYLALADNTEQQAQAYALLFKAGLTENEIKLISNSSLKGWVLGSSEYQAEVSELTQRQVAPKPKGGDRRSEQYRASVKAKQGCEVADQTVTQRGLGIQREPELVVASSIDIKEVAVAELTEQLDKPLPAEAVVPVEQYAGEKQACPPALNVVEPQERSRGKTEEKKPKTRKQEFEAIQGSLF